MWLLSDDGFVSLVQHNTDPTLIRARARRREHLQETFELQDGDIIDLGEQAPDYRWHADIPRTTVAQKLYEQVMDLSYVSHVKESVAKDDDVFYRSMLDCWTALRRMQDPPRPEQDWWTRNDDGTPTAWYDDWESRNRAYVGATRLSQQAFTDTRREVGASLNDLGDIAGQVGQLADKMVAAGFGNDVKADLPTHDPLPTTTVTTAWLLDDDVDQADRVCAVCGDDFEAGNKIVALPEDEWEPAANAHVRCAEDEGWTVAS